MKRPDATTVGLAVAGCWVGWLLSSTCPAGLPYTGNDPATDHGHTDCLFAHTAAAQLDRIAAALGDVPDWIDAMEANIGNHCTVMSVSAQADLVTLFRRLADALEDTDAD